MKTTIYYYTGTGNSLWVSRSLAALLGDTEVVSMAGLKERTATSGSKVVGLVFPVYIWGVPGRVCRFAGNLGGLGQEYTFAVAVNGGQVSNTLVQLAKAVKKGGSTLSAGFEIKMPSNYIPWGGPGPEEEQRKLFEAALAKMGRIVESVKAGKSGPIEKGPLWHRLLFTQVYRMTFSRIAAMDKAFWVDEKCNGCGICSRVCPTQNVSLEAGKPRWSHRCEQCFSCLQWCPKEAIQYGKKTPKYERYHHPEISLKDVIKR